MNCQQTSQAFLVKGEYESAVSCLEQAIEADPLSVQNYLTLGIVYLLLDQEEAAQSTWLYGLSQVEEAVIPEWTTRLTNLLEIECELQAPEKIEKIWLLRQHIREIAPEKVNNLLRLIQIELKLNRFTPNQIEDWRVIAALEKSTKEDIDQELLLQVLEQLLMLHTDEAIEFAEHCQAFVDSVPSLVNISFRIARSVTPSSEGYHYGIKLLRFALNLAPQERQILGLLWSYYGMLQQWKEAISFAHRYLATSLTLEEKFVGTCLLMDAYVKGGHWLELESTFIEQKRLLNELINAKDFTINIVTIKNLACNLSPLLYVEDNLKINRYLQNAASKIVCEAIQKNYGSKKNGSSCNNLKSKRPLKVGFLTYTFRNHSVGWLSRWLFKYLDKSRFHYSIYLLNMKPSDLFFQNWFAKQVHSVYTCPESFEASAEIIAADEVDILIDLDSLTLDSSCMVLSLKPAPIQATWLGWDATGLPSVDYFIADPYVLPEYAQEHYTEKIWRLPSTYVAVDGFEADVPSLRRSDFNIPTDAIVYFSSQRAMKQHPDVIQCQMQIIKQVPNSYLLIKAGADIALNEDYFVYIADKVGVSLDRIRFLGRTENEFIHRANLRLADVVLDTFPYNGATTTLEALWMGLPLVTKVGEQFTARYSYAFLKNVGVEEGIAYTDNEYIEWGVRLGKDEKLRQQVAWKLRQSRHTSPLWNTKQFARDMENAFLQMWQTYVETSV